MDEPFQCNPRGDFLANRRRLTKVCFLRTPCCADTTFSGLSAGAIVVLESSQPTQLVPGSDQHRHRRVANREPPNRRGVSRRVPARAGEVTLADYVPSSSRR